MSALASTIQNYIYGPDKFSKPKKNFIKENMKHIKKMQNEPKEKSVKKITYHQLTRKGEKQKTTVTQSGLENFIKIKKDEKNEIKEQGCQTSIFDSNSGQILFPKKRLPTPPPLDGKRNMSLQVNPIDDLINKQKSSLTVMTPSNIPLKEDGKIDFVRLNMLMKNKKKKGNDKCDPINAPPTYQRGVVPRYLKESKKRSVEDVQEKGLVELIEDLDDNCYSLVPDEEKKERLKEIRSAYAQLILELNTLPVRNNTPNVQAKKDKIETTLAKLEDGIKLFSRQKLFVKIK